MTPPHTKSTPDSLSNRTLPSLLNWSPPSLKPSQLHSISVLPSSDYAQCTWSHCHPLSEFCLGIKIYAPFQFFFHTQKLHFTCHHLSILQYLTFSPIPFNLTFLCLFTRQFSVFLNDYLSLWMFPSKMTMHSKFVLATPSTLVGPFVRYKFSSSFFIYCCHMYHCSDTP